MAFSRLDTRWATRGGDGGRTLVRYLDLVIDGDPLGRHIKADTVTPLGHGPDDWQDEAIDRFLGLGAADAPGDRTSFYVCGECGDLGCGAITAVIERGPGVVVWRNFGYQNNYEAKISADDYRGLGPFTFDAAEYDAFFDALRPSHR